VLLPDSLGERRFTDRLEGRQQVLFLDREVRLQVTFEGFHHPIP
jgi:hypothetical protein